jgi:hypothetical protein
MEQRGRNGRQRFGAAKALERLEVPPGDRESHEREGHERRRQPNRATESGLALGDQFR